MTLTEYTCSRCEARWGTVSPTDSDLCFVCREDDQWQAQGMPLCSACGKHRVGPKTFDAGGTKCRFCWQLDFYASVDAEYEPVWEIVRDFTGLEPYVEQTGGNVMVGTIPLGDPEWFLEGMCAHCEREIARDAHGSPWYHVGDNVGDEYTACGPFEPYQARWRSDSDVAEPSKSDPAVWVTHDSDSTWTICLYRHWQDYEGNWGINTADLPSGDWENPWAGNCSTPEDVAARIILLIENPDYSRNSFYKEA